MPSQVQRVKQQYRYNRFFSLKQKILESSRQELFKHVKKATFFNSCLVYDRFPSKGLIEERILSPEESLFQVLEDQLQKDIFPTPLSLKIAYEIIFDITADGFFDGDTADIAKTCGTSREEVEKIRSRILHFFEPPGVGAKDTIESFRQQLQRLDLDPGLFEKTKQIANDMANIQNYRNNARFKRALQIIATLKNPPALEYMRPSLQIAADFTVKLDNEIDIIAHGTLAQDIKLKIPQNVQNTESKEAARLLEMLQYRDTLLQKVTTYALHAQYDYLIGGRKKALLVKQVAHDLDSSPSSVSRVIANKYIQLPTGLIPIKQLFEKDVHSSGITAKDICFFLQTIIQNEPKNTPYSDTMLQQKIKEEFNIKLTRKTAGNYRALLGIENAKKRKTISFDQ
ncbi:MAG: hypothetical protein ACQERK_04315 [Campylobacterota bacterium]